MQKHTTKRTPKQSPKKRPTRAPASAGTETHKTKNRAHSRAFDHPLTSQKGMVKDSQGIIRLSPALRFLRGAEVREFRKAHNLSAKTLAALLVKNKKTGAHFSRTYVKSVEGNSLRASAAFVQAFDELKAHRGEGETAPRSIAAIFHHMPAGEVQEIEIIARPVRCVCGKWFVPSTPNQRTHSNANCHRLARAAARKTKRARARVKKTS